MLIDSINQDYLKAYKTGDDFSVEVLRLIKSALKNAEIDQRHILSESETLKVLKKEAKIRQDAIRTYQYANKPEAIKKEVRELELIKKYLPSELSDSKITQIIKEVISALPESDRNNFGKIMGTTLKKNPDLDGSKVSQILRQLQNKNE